MNIMNKDCDLYVHIELKKDELIRLLGRVLPIEKEYKNSEIWSNNIHMYLEKNSDEDESSINDMPNGFLYYHYIFEICPSSENTNFDEYVKAIGSILNVIWDAGGKAVASCDFEELLPEKGGYKSPKNMG